MMRCGFVLIVMRMRQWKVFSRWSHFMNLEQRNPKSELDCSAHYLEGSSILLLAIQLDRCAVLL